MAGDLKRGGCVCVGKGFMALALRGFSPCWQSCLLVLLPAAGLEPQGSPGIPAVSGEGSGACAPSLFLITLNLLFDSKLAQDALQEAGCDSPE